MDSNYSVEMIDIYKSFGGVQALKNVSFRACPGEVHALMGENGAGKSTLIKVLAGAIPCDSGTIKINGKIANIHNALDAKKLGVSVIYQEMNLVGHLSAAENLFLGEDVNLNRPIHNQKLLCKKSREIFEKIDFNIDPEEIVMNLSIAYQQMLEVAKAVSHDSDIIVFDEPTAVLSVAESEKLFQVIEELRRQNKCIIYISHRMQEVMRLADKVTVMKDGELVGTYERKDINESFVVEKMIGRKLEDMFPEKPDRIGEVIFEAKNLCRGDKVKNVSFNVKKGEIVGFYGLIGAGKTETMRLIFGADKLESGEMFLNGKPIVIKSPKSAIRNGIAYISENRKDEGIILDMAIRDNVTMVDLSEYTKGSWILSGKENKKVDQLIDMLRIKTDKRTSPAGSLSGGNQQKVSLAKWLAKENDLILFDEPTRGVDVGAKAEIYNIIADLAKEGVAVVIVSSEMTEVIGTCNRVLVMYEGEITGEAQGDELTEQKLMSLALAMA